MQERAKNRHAVALGRRGGKAGKGSEKRREAAIKANRIRWKDHGMPKLEGDPIETVFA